jgi:hypothetical protein
MGLFSAEMLVMSSMPLGAVAWRGGGVNVKSRQYVFY